MASSSDDTSSSTSSSDNDDHPESYYDSWSRGPWRWEGVTRVRQLVNTSILEMQRVRWSAQAVASSHVRRANGPGALALRKLRHIQDSLATAPTIMRGDMHWLILVMVGNRPDQHEDLRGMVEALPHSDFSVYHYDSHSPSDEAHQAYARQPWYAKAAVHRGFVTGSGCTVEALKNTIGWMLHGDGAGRYTHLWNVDSDLGFGLFRYDAFSALVAHRAPFLAQPAIVPSMRGKRATDRQSLRAVLGPVPTMEVVGRERLLMRTMPPKDDVEIMCPLIDARILPAVEVAIAPMDTRNDVVAGEAINTIAQAFADVTRLQAARVSPAQRPRRPGGLVFDYMPLVHRDSRLLGWGSRTRKEKNETRCPRTRLDGRFGRGNHPHHGHWHDTFANATRPEIDLWSWLPLKMSY